MAVGLAGVYKDMNPLRLMPSPPESSDEELMRQLAGGSSDALRPLYSRYAPMIFGLAARSLDRATAEEIVQDVFVAVWRRANTYDPARGAFRPWVFQIAQHRVLNELRRRSRRPQTESDPDGARLAALPDDSAQPAEAAWREFRREALQAAFEELPPPQRQALGLSFFEDLTHEQVAAVLNLPLGTAKTRIRTGLQKLRGKLSPEVAAAALVAVLAIVGLLTVRYRSQQTLLARDDRALALLTASDSVNFRLAPAPGVSTDTHARYHGRAGSPLAVVTLSKFAPAPTGQTYQVWASHHGAWTSLGTLQPDADGGARLIAEDAGLAELPEELHVTIEPAAGSATPSGPVVVSWSEK
ncbi:MAG TPA: sigma-70 family RNA polymerase sigma factor [Candidatus Kryptonia bacterium]|nr:sigma-70 family RNA polymerase sigma factor [Candidatus Kryptonia bacterium]